MTFEPLTDTNDWPFILRICGEVALGAFASAIIVFFVTLGYLRLKKSENMDKPGEAGFAAFMLGGVIVALFLFQAQFADNQKVVTENLKQKYAIEEVTFAPQGRGGPKYLPEQTEAQPITIKVHGESRLANLVQDRATAEPTLLNVDTGKPLDDILRK